MAASNPHVLVLATADWDAPLWTNKQYVALELAREFRVTYVESLGLRKVRLSRADVRRVLRRARRVVGRDESLEGHRARPSGLEVVSPLALPFHGSVAARTLNPAILRRSVQAWGASPTRLLWTFNPVTYGLHQIADRTVYHAVDLMHESPRHYTGPILAGERDLAASNCEAIASSRIVARHLEEVGFDDVRVWENVADVQLFAEAARLRERRPTVVLFAGNLSPFKVDFDLLESVASIPGCELHIAGPAAIDGSVTPDISRLRDAGAIFHGPLAPRQLADIAGEAAVGIIPYLLNDYTAGVFPMKLYEYLSAGAAVVSTALPSLAGRESSDVVIARSPSAFVRAVRANLVLPDAATLLRRQGAAAHASWQVRGEAIRDAVRESFETDLPMLSKVAAR